MTEKNPLGGHTVFELYCSGLRFVDDFDEDAAVSMYLEMHPQANEAAVRAQLTREIAVQDAGQHRP